MRSNGDGDDIRFALQNERANYEQYLSLYKLMQKYNKVNECSVAEYRCANPRRACLLAHVCLGPDGGLFVYRPSYRLSPAAAQTRTSTGCQRWSESAFTLPDEAGPWVQMVCDHTDRSLSPSQLWDDIDVCRSTGRRTIRRISGADGLGGSIGVR